MAELSESELLLLDNFMYISESATEGRTVGDVVDMLLNGSEGVKPDMLSGSLKVDEAEDILKEIQQNPELCELTIAASIDNEGVRASCFVDENNHATVAFRGTGGSYEAWKDNVLGAYEVDTDCQKMAAEFIQEDCGRYTDITVTGHSKGGNMAQYCTVTCGDQIDRCVSYDGQGFNEDFIKHYADEIAANQDKISSICCDEDYVNILLTPIAGETKYLDTQEGANAHASWGLYCHNRSLLDENGDFAFLVEQAEGTQLLDRAVDGLVEHLGRLPKREEQAIIDALASDAGLAMAFFSGQLGLGDLVDWYWTNFKTNLVRQYYNMPLGMAEEFLTGLYHSIKDCGEKIAGLWKKETQSASAAGFSIWLRKLQGNAQEAAEIEQELLAIADRLEAVSLPGRLGGNEDLKQAIRLIVQEVKTQRKTVMGYHQTLGGCIRCYQEAELRCAQQAAAGRA